jgi:hypothetical protein
MFIFKIKSVSLLCIYVTTCLIGNFMQLFCVTSHYFKYIESQFLSCLAHDLLSEVFCCPHVEELGDHWSSGPYVMVTYY